MALMALDIAWNIIVLFVMNSVFPSINPPPQHAAFRVTWILLQVMFIVLIASITAFSVLYCWIIWKLCTPAIRREFVKSA
jgi:hypothetical protein